MPALTSWPLSLRLADGAIKVIAEHFVLFYR
jgi:hypothetical protein